MGSIVGKGNHSPGHIQKIKPKVEEVCQELGLQYATEPNAGRMYVNLQGGAAVMPEQFKHHGGGGGGGGGQHHGGDSNNISNTASSNPGVSGREYVSADESSTAAAGGYQGQQQYGGQQQQDPNAEIEAEVKKYLPKILRMCQRQCCTVM